MTAREVLDLAAVAGIDVYLRDTGQPAVRGGIPNAALMAALKEHRTGIIRLLGGDPSPDWCDECRAWISEAVDSESFCSLKACVFRRRVRATR